MLQLTEKTVTEPGWYWVIPPTDRAGYFDLLSDMDVSNKNALGFVYGLSPGTYFGPIDTAAIITGNHGLDTKRLDWLEENFGDQFYVNCCRKDSGDVRDVIDAAMEAKPVGRGSDSGDGSVNPKENESKYCPCYTYMDGNTDPNCPMHGNPKGD